MSAIRKKVGHDAEALRALDELFVAARRYRNSDDYWELMRFLVRFRDYSPYNAMLVSMQLPGARFVATASRWRSAYGRTVKPDARPLVILQPMGPVMFVFDVSDTVGGQNAIPLPPGVIAPFEVRGARVGAELQRTSENAARDGIEVIAAEAGSQSAGSIQAVSGGQALRFLLRARPQQEYLQVPRRYAVLLNRDHSPEAQYATLVHELAHLYCGHLGSPSERLWPDRRAVADSSAEFEAESVSYLVCRRLGLETTSEAYLSGYSAKHEDTPPISLDLVLKVAGLIEQMGRERMRPRKERTG